jgi:hypothetical protein
MVLRDERQILRGRTRFKSKDWLEDCRHEVILREERASDSRLF